MTKQHIRAHGVRPCRLDAADLKRLVRLMCGDAEQPSRGERFSISASLPDGRVSVTTVDELLAHRDLPGRLTDITLEYHNWDIDRQSRLQLWPASGRLTVEGGDRQWVDETFTRLEDFLRRRTPWYWFLRPLLLYLAFPYAVIALSLLMPPYYQRYWRVPLGIALVFVFVLIAVPYAKHLLLPHTLVLLHAEPQAGARLFVAYVRALLGQWGFSLFLLGDLFGLFQNLDVLPFKAPATVWWLFAMACLFWAGFEVYRKDMAALQEKVEDAPRPRGPHA